MTEYSQLIFLFVFIIKGRMNYYLRKENDFFCLLNDDEWWMGELISLVILSSGRERGIVCILQYLKVPQDFQQLYSLETAQIAVLNGELCRKTTAETWLLSYSSF